MDRYIDLLSREFRSAFASNLKIILGYRGLTPTEFSVRLRPLSLESVEDILDGMSGDISHDLIKKIGEALDVGPRFLRTTRSYPFHLVAVELTKSRMISVYVPVRPRTAFVPSKPKATTPQVSIIDLFKQAAPPPVSVRISQTTPSVRERKGEEWVFTRGFKKILAKNISLILGYYRMGPSEFGKKLGLSTSFMGNLAQGGAALDDSRLNGIARILNVEVSFLTVTRVYDSKEVETYIEDLQRKKAAS